MYERPCLKIYSRLRWVDQIRYTFVIEVERVDDGHIIFSSEGVPVMTLPVTTSLWQVIHRLRRDEPQYRLHISRNLTLATGITSKMANLYTPETEDAC